MRRERGRIGTGALLGAVGVCFALLAGIALFGRQSIGEAGSQFMTALATRDAARLTELTSLGEDSPATIRKKWDETIEKSKYYAFAWLVKGSNVNADDTRGAIRLEVSRNADSASTYGENFQLPMVKKDGRWKVEVGEISREMYPFLPRPGGTP